MPETSRVAVLIDCDNISARWASAIVAETAGHGTLAVKRGYGDWTDPHLGGWREAFAQLAVQPVQQFAYVTGKNATDAALIIDAMDLLYAGTVDTFCLVSNDSDFTPLAMRLRESGKRVIGLGARNASQAFQNACDRFTYVEVIATRDAADAPVAPDVAEQPEVMSLEEAAAILLPAITAATRDDGWASLSAVGNVAVNREPTFDSRNYGYARLGQLVRAIDQVEIKEGSSDPGGVSVRVRSGAAKRAARPAKGGAKKAAKKPSGGQGGRGAKAKA